MNTRLFSIPFLLCAVVGCGTIETHEQVSQPITKVLDTHVGGTIFKVERTRPLPNAFGGADIFGRKVCVGYTELRYAGMTDDGRLLLRVTDVEIYSTETTMSRSGQSSFAGYVDAYGNVRGIVTPPPQGSTMILPPNTTQFAFDVEKERDLTIAGVRVQFLEFKPQSVKYLLEKQPE